MGESKRSVVAHGQFGSALGKLEQRWQQLLPIQAATSAPTATIIRSATML